ERYDFVITANQPVGAYWIQLRGLGECGIRRAQQLAILRYARGPYQPTSAAPTYDVGIPQVAPTGDHVISLIDEISYLSAPAPLTSQYNDINPEQFCNGDNRPADCGPNCMCTHKIDIPLNAIVEVVLVDEVVPRGDHLTSLVDEISYISPPAPPYHKAKTYRPNTSATETIDRRTVSKL
ncbi:hypothetical protein M5D96_009476, partial [Drosophila gunungcola]